MRWHITIEASHRHRRKNHKKYKRNFYERKTRNSIFWNFFGTIYENFLESICWEYFWKLYAGNFLMATMCWEIRVDAGGFLKGKIMAQCYSIILRFKTMVPGAQLSIVAVQIFLERCKAKALLEVSKVIGRSSRGMGMLNPRWYLSETMSGSMAVMKCIRRL